MSLRNGDAARRWCRLSIVSVNGTVGIGRTSTCRPQGAPSSSGVSGIRISSTGAIGVCQYSLGRRSALANAGFAGVPAASAEATT